ncbi:Right origin-binding protein [Serratia plymuthica]|uniref:Right origin-binding protein n=1 Tax=Serratia plymuthica TaxID=82996 RepID=A0A2X4UMC9_SERPL|nr:Right origin-binding protein [Serratia plymuthica]
MDRVNIIHDLLNWIETHLDQPLLLDNVAAKSGYSKWHLQRMFRSTTGHALGSYIRERRLSQAAQALRSTPRPILDIALQFHFDSQPSFHAHLKNSSAKRRRCIAAPRAGTW